MMKKIISFCCMVVGFLLLTLQPVQAAQINQIVFFGDSLTDNGNLYKILLHVLPKSPPYFNGRFSNGPTWSDVVSDYYQNNYAIKAKNYAVGGATVLFHVPTPKYISPAMLDNEIDNYIADSLFTDRSKALFIIWIGDNDYIFDPTANINVTTTKVVDKVEAAITKLIGYGAKHIFVMNLVDASRTPKIQSEGTAAEIHAFIVAHNLKLDAALDRIRKANPHLSLGMMNMYDLFNDFMDNIEKYNEKYKIHITSTTDVCWGGGYWLQSVNKKSIAQAVRQTLLATKDASLTNLGAETTANMSDFVQSTPELAYVYQLTKSYEAGNLPCVNPNEHMFWDSIHPTSVVHNLLGQVLIEALAPEFN